MQLTSLFITISPILTAELTHIGMPSITPQALRSLEHLPKHPMAKHPMTQRNTDVLRIDYPQVLWPHAGRTRETYHAYQGGEHSRRYNPFLLSEWHFQGTPCIKACPRHCIFGLLTISHQQATIELLQLMLGNCVPKQDHIACSLRIALHRVATIDSS